MITRERLKELRHLYGDLRVDYLLDRLEEAVDEIDRLNQKNNTVYMVESRYWDTYSGSRYHVEGLFSTRDKAQEWITNRKKEFPRGETVYEILTRHLN